MDLLIYYFPLITTLNALLRVREVNTRNKRKYGVAWDNYCREVPCDIVPKVY